MAKKFNILDHIPAFDEDKDCERCGATGSRCFTWDHFAEERLCPQCTLDDVQGKINERID